LNLVNDQPQSRICGLMAEIENAQGDKEKSRDWLAKALHATRDPIWVSDGVAAARWTPVSPVTGEIVPCEWKPPFEMLSTDQVLLDFKSPAPQIERKTQGPEEIARVPLPDDPGID
jgi:HemY protein